jgi:hypothetical protein
MIPCASSEEIRKIFAAPSTSVCWSTSIARCSNRSVNRDRGSAQGTRTCFPPDGHRSAHAGFARGGTSGTGSGRGASRSALHRGGAARSLSRTRDTATSSFSRAPRTRRPAASSHQGPLWRRSTRSEPKDLLVKFGVSHAPIVRDRRGPRRVALSRNRRARAARGVTRAVQRPVGTRSGPPFSPMGPGRWLTLAHPANAAPHPSTRASFLPPVSREGAPGIPRTACRRRVHLHAAG